MPPRFTPGDKQGCGRGRDNSTQDGLNPDKYTKPVVVGIIEPGFQPHIQICADSYGSSNYAASRCIIITDLVNYLLEAKMAQDEFQAIYKEIEAFKEAWNKGDAKAAALFFTEDGARVGASGDIQRGHAELERAYDWLLHQTMPGAVVSLERGTIRMLTPEFALWQGGLEITSPDGKRVLRGYVVQVMRKVGGRWLVLEAHPKFYPPTVT